MGANILLISPDLLMEDGLLTEDELKPYHLRSGNCVNFTAALQAKLQLLNAAYNRFVNGDLKTLKDLFIQFCKKEAPWLDDFALYVVLKSKYNNLPWPEWPSKYRLRNKRALAEFQAKNRYRLEEVKWHQFINIILLRGRT